MMRPVLVRRPPPAETPEILENPGRFIYGIQLPSTGRKGWIEKDQFEYDDKFQLRAVTNINQRNGWGLNPLTFAQLQRLLEELNAKIFLFESSKELLNWLAKD